MRLIDADDVISVENLCQYRELALSLGNVFTVKDILNDAPTIDPIHAAGACYCRECVHYRTTKDWNSKKYSACHLRADVCILKKRPNDFCSCGEKADFRGGGYRPAILIADESTHFDSEEDQE